MAREPTLYYWLRFIKSRFVGTGTKPMVILAGTKRDIKGAKARLDEKGCWVSDWGGHILRQVSEEFKDVLNNHNHFFVLDAQASGCNELQALKDCLAACRKEIMTNSAKVPKVVKLVIDALAGLRKMKVWSPRPGSILIGGSHWRHDAQHHRLPCRHWRDCVVP